MQITLRQTVLLAQTKQLSLKTQQRFSVFGTCFDVSNIISHYEYTVKIYNELYKFKYSLTVNFF